MSQYDSPPPYTPSSGTGRHHPPKANTGTISNDQKIASALDVKYPSEAQYNNLHAPRSGSPIPLPSNASGSSWNSQPTSDRASAFPAQGSNVEPVVVFHVRTTKILWKREVAVTVNGQSDVAFHVTFPRHCLFSSGPDVMIQRGSAAGPVVANARLKSYSMHGSASVEFPETQSRIDVERKSTCKRGYNVVLEGRAFEWRGTHHHGASKWSSGSLKLVDESGRILAVYVSADHKCWSNERRINIEVPGLSSAMIEQIVCTCLAIAEMETRRRNAGAASAGAIASA